jgi:hypothetical protein
VDANNFFFLLIPTLDGEAHAQTLSMLDQLPRIFDKQPFTSFATDRGIPAARTSLVDCLRISLDKLGVKHNGVARALCWDSDIVIPPEYEIGTLADAIKKADGNGWNLVGNYKVRLSKKHPWTNVLMHKAEFGQKRFYTDEEIAALKDFEPLPDTVSGLGFYYGDVWLDYKYHYDQAHPEDVGFFEDNEVPLRFLNIPLFHKKSYLV